MKLRFLPVLLMFFFIIATTVKINTAQVAQPTAPAPEKPKVTAANSPLCIPDQNNLNATMTSEREYIKIHLSHQWTLIGFIMTALAIIIGLFAYIGITSSRRVEKDIDRIEKDAFRLEKKVNESIDEAIKESKEIQTHCDHAESIVSDAEKKFKDKLDEAEKVSKDKFDKMDIKFREFITLAMKRVDEEVEKVHLARQAAEETKAGGELSPEIKRQIQDVVKTILKTPDSERSANDYFLMAYNSKDIDEQIQYYSKAIEIKPDFALAYSNRSAAYNDKGFYDLAIKDCNKAIELNPNYAHAYNNRANAYIETGLYDLAIKDYDKAIEFDSRDAVTYSNRANAYNKKRHYDLAIKDCGKALELNQNFADAFYNKSCSLSLRNNGGDIEEAIRMLEEAADKGFDDIELTKMDKELDNLRSHPKFDEILKKIEENAKKKGGK